MRPTTDTMFHYQWGQRMALGAQTAMQMGLHGIAANYANQARRHWLKVRWQP